MIIGREDNIIVFRCTSTSCARRNRSGVRGVLHRSSYTCVRAVRSQGRVQAVQPRHYGIASEKRERAHVSGVSDEGGVSDTDLRLVKNYS